MPELTNIQPVVDMSGDKEGKFAIPVPEMIALLNKLLTYENQAFYTYTHYSQILRSPYRDGIVEIFDEHAEQELQHATKLARRISALGGVTTVKAQPIPEAVDLEQMIPNLIAQEQDALLLYRSALPKCGENEGTRQMIETIIEQEQEHADELWLLTPRTPEHAVEMITSRLDKILDRGISPKKFNGKALSRFAEALLLMAQEDGFAIRVFSENPRRTVYDLAKPKGDDFQSVCRVKKSFTPKEVWACSCAGYPHMCNHVSIVKQWEKSGRKNGWQDAAYEFKKFMDSLENKGPKKPLKNIMHKKFPKLTKPDVVEKPMQDPQIVVNEE